MSIAHVPMTWNPGDVWTVEVCTIHIAENLSNCHVHFLLNRSFA